MNQVSGHTYLHRGKRGAKWRIKYRLPTGRQVHRTLGPVWKGRGRPPAGHFTKRIAEEHLQTILADARRGTLTGQERTGATFADAADEYLRYVGEVRRVDATTVADYRSVIDRYLRDEFGDQALEEITPDAIDAYKERLIADGKIGNRTIVRHLTVLHGIFKRAKRVWGLSENPASADLVERPRVVYTGEFDTFDRDEIERLATAAESKRDAALYKVAAFTGLRTGELFGLRWSDVDFVGGLLHVRRNWSHKERREKVPKGKRVRAVPMMPEVIDTLAKLKERERFTGDDDLVFGGGDGGHLDYYEHRARYKAALKRAKLREIRFHDLRHAFGTAAITKLDPHTVQSYMGHAHYSTTQRYLHHKPRREDAAALAEAFSTRADENEAPSGTAADRQVDALDRRSDQGQRGHDAPSPADLAGAESDH